MNSVAEGFASAGKAGHAATVALGYSGRSIASGVVSSFLPSVSFPLGDNASISVSPSIAFGSTRWLGATAAINTSYRDQTVSFGYNYRYNFMGFGGTKGSQHAVFANYKIGINDDLAISYGLTSFSGSDAQTTGQAGLHYKKFSAYYENDGYLGDNYDRYRTTGVGVYVNGIGASVNLYTESPPGGAGLESDKKWPAYYDANGLQAVLAIQAGNYTLGWNSPNVGNFIQNGVHKLKGAARFHWGIYADDNRKSYFTPEPFFGYRTKLPSSQF